MGDLKKINYLNGKMFCETNWWTEKLLGRGWHGFLGPEKSQKKFKN